MKSRGDHKMAHRLGANKKGNVLMIMGFAMIPITFSTGMVVDYSRATRLQTKLNAAADAAALAAVSQTMMKKDNTAAESAAIAMFKAQIGNQPGLIWNDADLRVVITGNNAATTTRTSTVTYTAKSTNAFAGVLGNAAMDIGGTATATATAAPNIDFYLALDTSSSMALPTTTAGFKVMDDAVKCAFACHSNKIENYVGNSIPTLILDNLKFAIAKGTYSTTGSGSNQKQVIDDKGSYIYPSRNATSSDEPNCRMDAKQNTSKNICIYNADGTYVDSYWYAINQGVRLRVTDERAAARDLMTLAQTYAAENSRAYRAALYTFDHTTNFKTISSLSTDLSAVRTAASGVDLVTVNDRQQNGCPPSGCTNNNKYLFTSYKSVMTNMLDAMPTVSGKGSNDPGDTPQAFLFLVTDGMSDEDIGSGRTRKAMQQDQINQCTAIKNRGIKIAILYTEYTVESIKDDEPGQRAIATAAIPDIAPALTKCASTDLMYTVKTDQSISEALQALFAKAVATARLSN
jgi:Flp pilus assembly protein TadG